MNNSPPTEPSIPSIRPNQSPFAVYIPINFLICKAELVEVQVHHLNSPHAKQMKDS